MNVICLGGRTVRTKKTWELVQTFLGAAFSNAPRDICAA